MCSDTLNLLMFSKRIYFNSACTLWSRCNLPILCPEDSTTRSVTFHYSRKHTVDQNTITILMRYSTNVETLNAIKQLTQ
jgi:hypothetical protein